MLDNFFDMTTIYNFVQLIYTWDHFSDIVGCNMKLLNRYEYNIVMNLGCLLIVVAITPDANGFHFGNH